MQGRQRRFEEMFKNARYPRVELIKAAAGSSRPDVVLFLFDSTQTLRLSQRFNPLERIARGEVSIAECDWLVRQSSVIARDGVDGVPVNLSNCVRIAALHHHPVMPPDIDLPPVRLMSMDNDELFCKSCLEAGINMVLFGHQHFAYQRTATSGAAGQTPFGPVAPVYFFCCASTSEYSVKKPGFYLYDIGTSGVDAYQFEWSGEGFTRNPTLTQLAFR
jgi:hypothetical protein